MLCYAKLGIPWNTECGTLKTGTFYLPIELNSVALRGTIEVVP